MNVEHKQLKNIRNRLNEFLRETTPSQLVKMALFMKIKVPKELIEKYVKKDVSE